MPPLSDPTRRCLFSFCFQTWVRFPRTHLQGDSPIIAILRVLVQTPKSLLKRQFILIVTFLLHLVIVVASSTRQFGFGLAQTRVIEGGKVFGSVGGKALRIGYKVFTLILAFKISGDLKNTLRELLNCKVNLARVLKTNTYYCSARGPLFLSELFVNSITLSEHTLSINLHLLSFAAFFSIQPV